VGAVRSVTAFTEIYIDSTEAGALWTMDQGRSERLSDVIYIQDGIDAMLLVPECFRKLGYKSEFVLCQARDGFDP
jgi:hypothetical protein